MHSDQTAGITGIFKVCIEFVLPIFSEQLLRNEDVYTLQAQVKYGTVARGYSICPLDQWWVWGERGNNELVHAEVT